MADLLMSWWTVTADDAREPWELRPLVSVGPLRFGARFHDVLISLRDDPGPFGPEDRAGEYHSGRGVKTYYRDNGLYAVSVDARSGPQVSLAGIKLTGQVPSRTEEALRAYAGRIDTSVHTLASEELFLPALGVFLRTERAGDVALTRPFLLEEANMLPSAQVGRREWLH
jgi:hypothetical protein